MLSFSREPDHVSDIGTNLFSSSKKEQLEGSKYNS